MKKKEIFKLLKEADQVYYTSGNVIMEDGAYDTLKDRAYNNWPDDPYFSDVGTEKISTKFEEKEHWNKMGSQRKVSSIEELEEKFQPFKGHHLIAQEKLDGFSLEVNYEKGEVKSAITRGDGIKGEDILNNVKKMKGFLPSIPYKHKVSLYCEGVITLDDFEEVKKAYIKEGKPEPSNPRNSASGISHREDGKLSQYITLKYFNIIGLDNETEASRVETLYDIVGEKNVVETCGLKGLHNINDVYQDYIKDKRKSLNYWIDGLVIKINDLNVQEELGSKNGRPKGQIALKFPAETTVTKLLDIEWNVSRTGRINPIALLKTVLLDGSRVSKASLHNVKRIKDLDLTKNCEVVIKKGGDIIPEVVSKLADNSNEKVEIPETCPSCNGPITKDDTFIWCTNDTCKSMIHESMINYFRVAGIENVGKSLIESLLSRGIVIDIPDFYKLTRKDFKGIEGVGETTINIYFSELEKTKETSPELFLMSLGVHGLSKATADALIKEFGDLEGVLNATEDQIVKIPGFAKKTASQIVEGLIQKESMISELLEYVTIKEKVKVQGTLTGKSICITGSLDKGSKADYAEAIEDAGGEYRTSVKKGLSYLVAADIESTSGKATKARKLGIPIIDEEELEELLQ